MGAAVVSGDVGVMVGVAVVASDVGISVGALSNDDGASVAAGAMELGDVVVVVLLLGACVGGTSTTDGATDGEDVGVTVVSVADGIAVGSKVGTIDSSTVLSMARPVKLQTKLRYDDCSGVGVAPGAVPSVARCALFPKQQSRLLSHKHASVKKLDCKVNGRSTKVVASCRKPSGPSN